MLKGGWVTAPIRVHCPPISSYTQMLPILLSGVTIRRLPMARRCPSPEMETASTSPQENWKGSSFSSVFPSWFQLLPSLSKTRI